jgi:hypothetical protein
MLLWYELYSQLQEIYLLQFRFRLSQQRDFEILLLELPGRQLQ